VLVVVVLQLALLLRNSLNLELAAIVLRALRGVQLAGRGVERLVEVDRVHLGLV
jgi:hypothetical protein